MLTTVYATDSQIAGDSQHGYELSNEVDGPLRMAVDQLIEGLRWVGHEYDAQATRAQTPLKRYA